MYGPFVTKNGFMTMLIAAMSETRGLFCDRIHGGRMTPKPFSSQPKPQNVSVYR